VSAKVLFEPSDAVWIRLDPHHIVRNVEKTRGHGADAAAYLEHASADVRA